MPLPSNLADARRLAADALAAGAVRAARALGHRGLAAADQDLAQHADRLTVRTDQLTSAEDRITALRARLDQAEARARDAAAAQRSSDVKAQRAYDEARAALADELAAERVRAGRALDRSYAVLEVLVQRGHLDAVREGSDTVDAVARALDHAVPAGAEITARLAEVLWQTGQSDVGGAVEHAFLSQPACRQLAYVLAPVVAGWLHAAGHPDPTQPSSATGELFETAEASR